MVRYRKLGRVEINVSNLARSRAFYQDVVGLQPVGVGPHGEALLRCDHEHHNLALFEGPTPGLRCVGFMLEAEAQFEPLIAALQCGGLEPRAVQPALCAERYQKRAVRVFEPRVGAVIEFYVPTDDSARPFESTVARIQRLGHVVFNTTRASEAVAFWRDVLNFKISDSVGDAVTFMRCWPSPFHHGIGIARFARESLHHVNYMVTEIDDIGRALGRLRRAEAPVVYGPGRHPASDSVFLYFLDPDGMTMEYSFGMEAFSEAWARAPRQLPLTPESLDYWDSVRDLRAFEGAGANAPLE